MLTTRLARALALAVAAASLASCGLLVGLGNYANAPADGGTEAGRSDSGTAPVDGTAPDQTVSEGGPSDAAHPVDSTLPPDAADSAPDSAADSAVKVDSAAHPDASIYSASFSDAGAWESVDLTTVATDAGPEGYTAGPFFGAVFDNRYLYFASATSEGTQSAAFVARFDTSKASFGDPSAWEVVDLATLFLGYEMGGFEGSVFDGTYVYFAPAGGAPILRFDTKGDLFDASSWQPTPVATRVTCKVQCGIFFSGALYDGHAVYFLGTPGAPNQDLIFRFAPIDGGSFVVDGGIDPDAGPDWSTFPSSELVPPGEGFFGGAFDGRYAYFVSASGASQVLRYDTASSFSVADTTDWTNIPLEPPDASVQAFNGAVYDGTYVYTTSQGVGPSGEVILAQIPANGSDGPVGLVDLHADNPLVKALLGGVFDGRYVTFVPGEGNSIAVRYDTTAGAITPGSQFEYFDTTTVAPGASSFAGGAFDGQYVYFVPNGGTVAVRFLATTRPVSPPQISGGSFY